LTALIFRSLGIYDCFFGNGFVWIDLGLHLQRYKSSEIPVSFFAMKFTWEIAYFQENVLVDKGRSALVPRKLAHPNLTLLTHPLRERPKIQANSDAYPTLILTRALSYLATLSSHPHPHFPYHSDSFIPDQLQQPIETLCPAKPTKSPPSAARMPSAMASPVRWTVLLSLTCAESVTRACR